MVQVLLATTATQAFFSLVPEDAELMQALLSATVRSGATSLDLATCRSGCGSGSPGAGRFREQRRFSLVERSDQIPGNRGGNVVTVEVVRDTQQLIITLANR